MSQNPKSLHLSFFDTDNVLGFFRTVTIMANSKCCKTICKHPYIMKNVQGKHLRLKKWNQVRMGHSGCEFHCLKEETFNQMM